MSALQQPLWATPDDGISTETSDAQLDVERSLAAFLAPYHHHPDSVQQEELSNPWIDDQDKGKGRSKSAPPALNRAAHLAFLARWLNPLPGAYVAFDSNRSWILFWVTHGHDLLRAGLAPHIRAQVVATLLSFQHRDGGFGGGPDQIPHLMSTYPAICALAIVGGPGSAPTAEELRAGAVANASKGGWDAIDRKAMYRWMMSLKQPDGSFVVHAGGEVDVRASYCVSCISLLLGICTPELVEGMQDFIVSCQTYEGGLAASSHPSHFFGDSFGPQPQLGEAHGGYAHCALASYLSIIALKETYQDIKANVETEPSSSTRREAAPAQLDLDALLRWACSQQGLAIELGAFRGRTNKLVDGCYGWFGGAGLFAVLDACLIQQRGKRRRRNPPLVVPEPAATGTEAEAPSNGEAQANQAEDGWSTESGEDEEYNPFAPIQDDWLFDPIALQEYILIAAQTSTNPEQTGANWGGLRDKPSKKADAYHTCYNLSGLSLCQHRIVRSTEAQLLLEQSWKSGNSGDDTTPTPEAPVNSPSAVQEPKDWQKACYVSSLAWLAEPESAAVKPGGGSSRIVGDPKTNTVMPTHPIFNLTFPRVKLMMDWAYDQR